MAARLHAPDCSLTAGQLLSGPSALVFIVLIGLIDHNAAKFFRSIDQTLIAVVPLGGKFVEKDRALIWEPNLDKAGLADVGAKPASLFDVIVVGVISGA